MSPVPADGLPDGLVLQRVGPADWADWRELRLQALLDTPLGFVRTHAESAVLGEDDWRAWLAELGGAWLVRDGARRPVAMAAVWEEDGLVWLGAVFVAPALRGHGLLDALVAAAVARASAAGVLRLEVHEDNGQARRAYARLGFEETGARRPYPLGPDRDEVEMVLHLQ